MRLSEMSGKEIIGLDNGERLGVIGDSDLEINTETGSIHAIIVPGGSFWFRKEARRHGHSLGRHRQNRAGYGDYSGK